MPHSSVPGLETYDQRLAERLVDIVALHRQSDAEGAALELA